jgi:hypothetical protein
MHQPNHACDQRRQIRALEPGSFESGIGKIRELAEQVGFGHRKIDVAQLARDEVGEAVERKVDCLACCAGLLGSFVGSSVRRVVLRAVVRVLFRAIVSSPAEPNDSRVAMC